MKKTISAVITVFLLIFGANALYGQQKAEAPVGKDGDFWVFKASVGGPNPVLSSDNPIGDFLVTYSGTDVKVFRLDGNTKEEVDRGIGQLRAMVRFEGDTEYLKFPLAVGNKWRTSYQRQVLRKRRMMEAQTEVTGFEEVTTPAGTFQAFKIERQDIGGPETVWQRTYFYSPQTKSIIKFRHETKVGEIREIELLKLGSHASQ